MNKSKNNIVVLKFGGSCFTSAHDYHEVARYLSNRVKRTHQKIVVVVSGMNGVTSNLKALGHSITEAMPSDALDNLLATGEMVSMSLLHAASRSKGLSSTTLNGFQAGIHTDSQFTRARIQSVDNRPIYKSLKSSDILIIAGGQGIDINNRLTMLGRNSSDLTAIAIAASLDLHQCEIFSDVCGVYSSDPYLVDESKLFSKIPFSTCIKASLSGAKVLYHQAVKIAMQYNIKIHCKILSGGNEIKGTTVGEGKPQAMIIPNNKALIFKLPDKTKTQSLLTYLKEKDINAVVTKRYLIIMDDTHNIHTLIENFDKELSYIKTHSIVTKIDETNRTCHRIVKRNVLRKISQILHKNVYGPAKRNPHFSKQSKNKSAISFIFKKK